MIRHTILILAGLAAVSCSKPSTPAATAKPAAPAARAASVPAAPAADVAMDQGPLAHRGAPKRKNGWWEFAAISVDGSTMGQQFLCVGDLSEAKYSAFDQLADGKCIKADFKRAGAKWEYETNCDMGAGPMLSKGSITGDIRNKYEIHQSVTAEGRTVTGTIKAQWKGQCPAGKKDGDLETSGYTISVL